LPTQREVGYVIISAETEFSSRQTNSGFAKYISPNEFRSKFRLRQAFAGNFGHIHQDHLESFLAMAA